jgi:hypothetical protein
MAASTVVIDAPSAEQAPHWHLGIGAVVAVFLLVAMLVGVLLLLADGSPVRSNRATATPSARISPVDALAGTDLGGSIGHRSGNQP